MAVKEPSIDEVLQSIKQSTEARVNNQDNADEDMPDDDVLTLEDDALVLDESLEVDAPVTEGGEDVEASAKPQDNASLTADQSDDEMIDINAFAAEGKSETITKAEAKSKVDQAIAELSSDDGSDPLAEIDAALSTKDEESPASSEAEAEANSEAEVSEAEGSETPPDETTSKEGDAPQSAEPAPTEKAETAETNAQPGEEIDPAAEAEALMAEVAAEDESLAYKSQEQTNASEDDASKPSGEEVAESADLTAPEGETSTEDSTEEPQVEKAADAKNEENPEVDASALADEMLSAESEEDTIAVEEADPETPAVENTEEVEETEEVDVGALMENAGEQPSTTDDNIDTRVEKDNTENQPTRVNLPAQPTASGFQIAFPAEVLAEALRPLVQDWVAENLPGIVENLVQEELSRLKDS